MLLYGPTSITNEEVPNMSPPFWLLLAQLPVPSGPGSIGLNMWYPPVWVSSRKAYPAVSVSAQPLEGAHRLGEMVSIPARLVLHVLPNMRPLSLAEANRALGLGRVFACAPVP